MGEFDSFRGVFAGIQLSLVALFLLDWAGPDSSLPLVAFVLLILGTALVGTALLDP